MRLTIRMKVFLGMVVVSLSFILISLVVMNRFIGKIADHEVSYDLRIGKRTYEQFTALRFNLITSKARSIAQTPHLRAAMNISGVDHETIFFTARQLHEVVEMNLMLLVDDQGKLLTDVGDSTLHGQELMTYAGVEVGLSGAEYSGIWPYRDNLYRIALTPIMMGEQVLGLLILGDLLGSASAAEIREFTGKDVLTLHSGKVLAASMENPEASPVAPDEIASLVKLLEKAGSTHDSSASPFRVVLGGKACLAVAVPFVDTEGYTVLCRALDEVESGVDALRTSVLGAGLVSMVLALTLSLWLSARVSRRILNLRDAADQFGAGMLRTRVRIQSNDEFGQLGETFNSMAVELQKAHDELGIRVMERTRELTATNEALKYEIKEHKQAQDRVLLLSNAIRSTNDCICITDLEDIAIFVNEAFEETYGYKEDELLGKNIRSLVRANSRKKGIDVNILPETVHGGWKGELWNRRKDGSEFPVWLSTSVIRDENENPVALVAVANDITERKQAEMELQMAKNAAESASLAKSEFLANMSHEIRTPLSAMMGMTDLALETELNSEQRDYLNVVQSSSESLLSLINDILDFSKIEAGQVEIEQTTFDFRAVVEDLADMLSVRAHAKGLEMLCYVEPELPLWVVGDPTRLRQVLVNLIGNSIKFTEHGVVSIKVESIKEVGDQADKKKKLGLHFMITDTGIGISKEQQTKIFEKFSQADSSTTRKFGGTGLGLSISKSLIKLMGGRLWLESEMGQGSTFHFELQLSLGKGKQIEDAEHGGHNLKDISALVIDDNRTNRFILQKTLTACDIQVTEAESGAEGLSFLHDSMQRFDLVILDQEMPEMDGIQLAQAIRKEAKFKDLKLIMLSSRDGLSTEQQQELDIADTVAKPVRQSQLIKFLTKALYSDEVEPENSVTVVESTQKSQLTLQHKVLLVEDNTTNQMLAKRILEKANYEVDVVGNGQMAVEAVEKIHYDLILMDIQMPVMGGFAATQKIRAMEHDLRKARTPVIALTAHALSGYREKCLQNDMDDYVTKPIKGKVLLGAVKKWIDPRPVILVVDAAADNRNLIKSYVKKAKQYRLVFAQNGQEAIDIFESRAVSIILMDMEMSALDGHTATLAIRKLEHGSEVPIIALTAHQGEREIKECFDAGCTAYLSKPIRKESLFEVLTQHLGASQLLSKPEAKEDFKVTVVEECSRKSTQPG